MSKSQAASREDVVAAYQALLGRAPESEAVIDWHLGGAPITAADLIRRFAAAPEFIARLHGSLFDHVNTTLDLKAIVERFAHAGRKPRPGHNVNFLGVAIATRFVPLLASMDGQLDPVPIPANWHADMAEWAAALHAVELAATRGEFVMIELGCGWGCWMNNTGVAAKRRGLRVQLVGIEGDEGHLAFAREALATNGIDTGEYTLLRGIAAARPGSALFPRQDKAGESWGLEPVFDASEAQVQAAIDSGQYEKLRMVALAEAIGERPVIDLIHMDIQGGEADLVEQTLGLLGERVRYLVIGTHSRSIEGRLIDALLGAGWLLEVERPAMFRFSDGKPVTYIDGVQGWRNPRHT